MPTSRSFARASSTASLNLSVSDYFNGKEPNKSINPDEAIVYGAVIQTTILCSNSSKNVQDLLLFNVAPLTLGIKTIGGVRTTCQVQHHSKKSEILSTYSNTNLVSSFKSMELTVLLPKMTTCSASSNSSCSPWCSSNQGHL